LKILKNCKPSTLSAIAFAFVVGVLLGRFLFVTNCRTQGGAFIKTIPSNQSETGSCEENADYTLDIVRRRLIEPPPLAIDKPANEIHGATLKSVEGQKIIVEFSASVLDPDKKGLMSRIVTVSEKTILLRQWQKDSETFDAELKAFAEGNKPFFSQGESSIRTAKLDGLGLPSPYMEGKISLGDLKTGDLVTIHTVSDIRKDKTFAADSIYLEAAPQS